MIHLALQMGLARSGAGLIVFDGTFAGVAVFGFRRVIIHAHGMETEWQGLCREVSPLLPRLSQPQSEFAAVCEGSVTDAGRRSASRRCLD